MAKSLAEYADWLADRNDLIWPKMLDAVAPKATPYVKPLLGIRLVVWDIYGTLLRIADGELLFDHPQKLRMQIALEKTVEEFKMWPSMHRKPGAPWEYLYEQYARMLERRRLSATRRKGDVPEIDAGDIWGQIIEQLEKKDYTWDTGFFGGPREFAEKVAFFFHQSLQATAGTASAHAAVLAVSRAELMQGLLANAQTFSIAQLLRALGSFGKLPPTEELFDNRVLVLSCQQGIRKPSPGLFQVLIEQANEQGIEPQEILYVAARLRDDLAIARQAGMRTALYAGDKESLQAAKSDINEASMRPDRLLTDLSQIKQILNLPG